MSWQERAACRGTSPELFYAEHRDGTLVYPEARVVCGACEVRSECLNQALTDGEDYGMWGGLVPKERDRISLRACNDAIAIAKRDWKAALRMEVA